MSRIMLLEKLADDLGYKNRRSVIRWCERNGLSIISFNGTKRKFISTEQYELILSKKINLNPSLNHVDDSNYKPLGNIEKSIMSILQKL